MAHPKARLNVLGRELLVTRVTVLGWPVVTAADAQGISRRNPSGLTTSMAAVIGYVVIAIVVIGAALLVAGPHHVV